MKASDIMSALVVTVPAAATIIEAARIMMDHGVSGLPVVNDEGRLVGMITEGDLFRRCEIETEPNPLLRSAGTEPNSEIGRQFIKSHGEHVADVMTRDVVRVFENTPLAEVATLLEQKQIKRVPVMRDGKIVGVISRADLLRALVRAVDARSN
jgi:CBS domain-containing protein